MGRFVARIQALALALGGPGPLPGRVPRFVVPVAAGNRRPAGDLDGDAAHRSAMRLVRRQRDARVGRRLSGAVLHRPQGRRCARAQAVQAGDTSTGAGRASAPRRDGRAHPVDPAAAGAVQDLRPARRRRRHRRRRGSRRPSPIGRGARYFAEGVAGALVRRAGDGVHARERHGAVSLVRWSACCWRVGFCRRISSVEQTVAGRRQGR